MTGLIWAGPGAAETLDGDTLADRFARDGQRSAAEQRRRSELEMLSRALAEKRRRVGTRGNMPGKDGSVMAESPVTTPVATNAIKNSHTEGGTAASVPAETARDRFEEVQQEVARRIADAEREAAHDRTAEQPHRARAGDPRDVQETDVQPSADAARRIGDRDRQPQRLGRGTAMVAETEPTVVSSEVRPEHGERREPRATAGGGQYATILLVMRPGRRGIRRINKLADPVLCMRDKCFVSHGADRAARSMSRGRALGTFNTLGSRAGACSNSLHCVFRNVEVGELAVWLQPVDLRLLRHDRRQAVHGRADPSCRVVGRRLTCGARLIAPDYEMWIVPEPVAERAGRDVLLDALARGLPEETAQWSRPRVHARR